MAAQELHVRGPYGNRFRLHVASSALALALGRGDGERSRPGSEGSHCVGMDTLTLEVEMGTATLEMFLRFFEWEYDGNVPLYTSYT
jgi:hypothetical protein